MEDIHPPKLLAIYRGAKFLYERRLKINGDKEIFDSATESHNVFPTKEECRIINDELELYGVNNVLGRLRLKEKKSSKCREISEVSDLSIRSNPADLTMSMETIVSGYVENPNIITLNYANNAANNSHEVVPVAASSSSVPIDVTFPTELEPVVGLPNGENQIVHFGNPELFSKVEIPFAAFELRKGDMRGIEPKLLLAGCTEAVVVVLTVRIEKKGLDGAYRVAKSRSHAYSKASWAKAVQMYGTSGPVEMCITFLLKQLFHKDELRDLTPSGREQKEPEEEKTDENGTKKNADRSTSKKKKTNRSGSKKRSNGKNEDNDEQYFCQGGKGRPYQKKSLDKGRQEPLLDTIRYLMWEIGLPQFEIYHLMEKALTTDIINVGTKVIRKRLKKDKAYYDAFNWE
ncbi:hypothetical protein Fcan01_16289 [Folsomia candida]|uniref:Uncharacterized protein n=1 Tax=Folsomia candida TaxID=158441 RepID=A0A226DSV3_FOLCA|nr:hypothetical protein Fcan01_16289 [Folsomia candida]